MSSSPSRSPRRSRASPMLPSVFARTSSSPASRAIARASRPTLIAWSSFPGVIVERDTAARTCAFARDGPESVRTRDAHSEVLAGGGLLALGRRQCEQKYARLGSGLGVTLGEQEMTCFEKFFAASLLGSKTLAPESE